MLWEISVLLRFDGLKNGCFWLGWAEVVVSLRDHRFSGCVIDRWGWVVTSSEAVYHKFMMPGDFLRLTKKHIRNTDFKSTALEACLLLLPTFPLALTIFHHGLTADFDC